MRPRPNLLAFLLLLVTFLPARAAEPQGQPALALALEALTVTASVLHIGAHPDDEDTALLAYLARGRGVRTAYLSATRGEGGQNLLGSEQYEALGLLRTEELLAARRLDGAEQFFTRAYDFGYSKDPAEALAKWGHERTLADFVRVIRRFRPDVIISRFAGGPQDGHGQHAAAGILAREAYSAAADPNRFPELAREGLPPWQAKKFYVELNRFGPAANQPLPADALRVELGDYSPILGRSYIELAMEGRSLHRSQAMGVPQRKGSFIQGFRLAETVLPGDIGQRRAAEHDLLDGIDAHLPSGPLLTQLQQARGSFAAGDTAALLAALANAVSLVRQLPQMLREWKEPQLIHAIALAHGVAVEALADRPELVPGDSFQVTVSVWNRARLPVQVNQVRLETPDGWQTVPAAWQAGAVEYNQNSSRAFRVFVPLAAPPSQPYWLRLPRHGESYDAPDPGFIGLPHEPPLLQARVRFSTFGADLEMPAAVQYRYVDRMYGQTDRPVTVVPRLAAWSEPPVLMLPSGAPREVTVRVNNVSKETLHAHFEMRQENGPAAVGGASADSALAVAPSEEKTTKRDVRLAGAEPGKFSVLFDKSVAVGYQLISYPHIRPQYWFKPAETRLIPVDVKLPANLRVGYIMGAGDEVPEALRQLGATVELLGAQDLLSGELSGFDAIVAGIRAYAVRKDLVEAKSRLLEYVRNGGVFIVQYNSDWPGRGGSGDFPFGPYPMRQTRNAPRVSVEEQPVEILAPSDSLFTTPNRITAADFAGWVQERGLYFMSEWAPQYEPLLSSHDPGEPPQKGGMLAARTGKGLYVYTGYSWFRQLPAGVPGAFRVWANLLSAGRSRRP